MTSQGTLAGSQETVLQQLRNPFGIFLVGLATWHILMCCAFAKNDCELSL